MKRRVFLVHAVIYSVSVSVSGVWAAEPEKREGRLLIDVVGREWSIRPVAIRTNPADRRCTQITLSECHRGR